MFPFICKNNFTERGSHTCVMSLEFLVWIFATSNVMLHYFITMRKYSYKKILKQKSCQTDSSE